MPFPSFNPTNPRTNPWNFGGNCSAFGRVEKLSFFESAILNFFFASSPWKLVTNYVLELMGLNFYHYDGLQPEMRAGIINEHECTYLSFDFDFCNMTFKSWMESIIEVPGLFNFWLWLINCDALSYFVPDNKNLCAQLNRWKHSFSRWNNFFKRKVFFGWE